MLHRSKLAAALLAALAAPSPREAATPPGEPRLVDITAHSGIHFQHLSSPEQKYIVESMSGGVAILDYDGDGWPDIYFTNAASVSMALAGKQARGALFHNNHDGTFTDVTDRAGVGLPCWAMGASVGDFDNDGRPDLLVSCFGGVVLYRNNGDGTFANVTSKSGLGADSGWATGAVFGDFNGDGLLDIFVPHYVQLDIAQLPKFGSTVTCQYHGIAVQCGPRGLKGSPDSLYKNNGNGTFSNVSLQAGVADEKRFFGLGAVWSDLDNDGKLDLVVANDGEANFLYRNLGNGRFAEIGYDAGIAANEDGLEQANMGLALADYNHTGLISIAISHFSEEYTALYRNDGAMSFTDVSRSSGIAAPTKNYVGWGIAFADLANSGWDDLVLVNGHVYPQVDDAQRGTHYREPGLVFLNQHNGTFQLAPASALSTLAEPHVSRGLATADLFNRGALDLVIENLEGAPLILSSQPPANTHWVSLALQAKPGQPTILNTRVRLVAGGNTQLQEVRSGGSYLSQSDLRLHFGLGSSTRIDRLEVLWPGGKKQIFANVAPDRFYTLSPGGDLQPAPHTPS